MIFARLTFAFTLCTTLLCLTACRQDMHDQPKYEPYEKTLFFADNRTARPMVDNTVPRGYLNENDEYYSGKTADGRVSENYPMQITVEVLQRGRERYNIFCAPCHDQLGTGQGMIVRRGYRRPPSMHIDRLRAAQPGYYYDVITNGFGAMPKYNVQVPPGDRWAIAAYIRVLQYSQRATIDDVPADQRQNLEGARKSEAQQSPHRNATHE